MKATGVAIASFSRVLLLCIAREKICSLYSPIVQAEIRSHFITCTYLDLNQSGQFKKKKKRFQLSEELAHNKRDELVGCWPGTE